LLNVPTVSGHLRRAVREASEGNPLFIEELAYSLMASSGMTAHVKSPASSNMMSGPLPFELPGSIESVIMSRVDKLNETAKETLKTASVIGRTFFVQVLSAVVGSDQAVQDGLLMLKREGLILDHRQRPEPACMFK